MAGPGGRTVGRVSLRVLPDTSRLREDIQKVVTRIERTVSITIPVKLDTDRLRGEAQRAIAIIEEALDADIRVNLDTTGLGAEITAARDRIEASVRGVRATLNADLDLALARARLAAFTARPRRVSVIATINEGSLGRITTLLSALSGARSAGKVLDRLGNSLKNLDKAIPAITGMTLAIGNLVSAALSSVAGLFAIGAGVAAISGAFLALPGVVGGFAVGITAMALALVDIKTQLGSLGPAFTNLQNVTSGAFWNVARQPILDMVNGLLPQLTAGFAATGESLGGFFADFAAGLQKNLGGGVLEGMFASLTASVDIARQAMAPLTQLIATLGSVGASYLPGLAQNFTNVTTKINEIIQAANADGSLRNWIDNGIAQAGYLFSALGGIAQIFGGIASAAQMAGTGGLGTFAAQMHRIADLVNTPAFQGALANIFRGANSAMHNLSQSLGPLGDLIVSMSPAINGALASLGATAGQLVGGLATALNDPAIASGLLAITDGIAVSIGGLAPAMAPLTGALGALLPLIGTLQGVIGTVLGSAFAALLPAVQSVATALQPLIVLLGTALVGTIGQLAPILMSLVTAVLPPLASVIEALVPALATVIGAVLPVLAALIPPIAQVLGLVAGVIVALLPPIAELVAQLVTSLAPVLTTLVNALLPVLEQVFAALVPVIAQLVTALGPLIATFVDALMPTIEALLPLIETIFGAIVPIIEAALQIIIGVIQVFTGVISGDWSLLWEGVKNILGGAWNAIKAIIVGAIEIVVGVLKAAWELIKATVGQAWSSIAGLVSSAWESLKTVVRNGIAALIGFVGPGLIQIVNFFLGLRGQVLSALGNVGEWLVESGRKIIDGLVQGIKGAASRVTDAVRDVMSAAREYFPFSPAKKGPFSGRQWTTYSGASIVDGLVEGIQSREGFLQAATNRMMTAAQPMLAEVSSSSFQSRAGGASAAGAAGPAVFNLYDADRQLIGTMQGIAQSSVDDAGAARVVASRQGVRVP